jgi:hypothetical protein
VIGYATNVGYQLTGVDPHHMIFARAWAVAEGVRPELSPMTEVTSNDCAQRQPMDSSRIRGFA